MTRDVFHQQLEALQTRLLEFGQSVEAAIQRAVQSLQHLDVAAARQVVADDAQINARHLAIESECIRLLALQQPMARDLRRIGTILKVITDLERMADHAVDIAKVTIRMGGAPLIKPLVDIPRMAQIAQEMVRAALNAFVTEDVAAAKAMIDRDHEVDALYKQVINDLEELMKRDPANLSQGTQLLFVAAFLERIADHATNLGEWVIYLVTGVRKELNN